MIYLNTSFSLLALSVALQLACTALHAQDAEKPRSPELVRLEKQIADIESTLGKNDAALAEPLFSLGWTHIGNENLPQAAEAFVRASQSDIPKS